MNLKDIRHQKKLSISELSRISGLSTATIANLERGKVSPVLMHFDTACRLAEGLGISVDDLARKLKIK